VKSRTVLILWIAAILDAAPPASVHYFRNSGLLTGESRGLPEEIALRFIHEAALFHNLTGSDLGSIYLARRYRTEHNGITHLTFRQRYSEIDVKYSDFVVNVDAAGRVVNAGGNLFPAPPGDIQKPQAASLSPSIRAAMKWADPVTAPDYVPMEVQGSGKVRRFQRIDGAGDIDARSMWYPFDGRLLPAWEFCLNDVSGARHAVAIHSRSQEVLDVQTLSWFQAPPPPRGLVFTGASPRPNPRPGFLMTEKPPIVPRVLVSFAGDAQASPAGWVEGTETEGNNVIAGKNPLGELFLVQPVTAKSAARDFQFPLELPPGSPNPTNFTDAAVTNLFYWMNRAHDLFWHIGFNEAAGNYQKQNFGRGGLGGDPIYTYAQFGIQQTFGATFNNAFYTTQGPEDGSPAMIAMFLGAGNDGFTDGSLDAEVMIHEYTHGVSSRLVRNLAGHHGGAMGEAWSDFFALEFTVPEGAPPDGVYAGGDYLFQRVNVGSRTRPYTTDITMNPITFADMGRVSSLPAIHQDGGIWVEALLEMRLNLMRQFGETEGRRRTRLLVIDGMKLSVPTPTMVDARDAILLADRTNFDGQSQMQIWQAFAKRGLGATAYTPSVNSTHVTASFVRPSNTGILVFSEPSYVFGEPVRVILHDANLRGDVALVQLTSHEVGGDVQTIRLRRNGAFYTGIVPTSSFTSAEREDVGLSVMPGSIISAYYVDAEADGGSRLIQASVPMQPGYTRVSLAPAFRMGDEQPLNLRGLPGLLISYDLPWEFPFFGRSYSALRVHANGLLTFDLPPPSACYDVPVLRQFTGIAPMHGNIRTNGSAQPNENVYVSRPSPDAITFRWAGETNVQPAFGVQPEPVNFAATLYRDGRIDFNYGDGNETLAFPSPISSICSATPSIGISNGNGTAVSLVTEYVGRASLENAPGVRFEPPYGAGSAPEIRIESPRAGEDQQGILAGQLVVWDANHFVPDVYVLIDGVLRGRAQLAGPRPDVCQAERLPNCLGFTFSFDFEALGLRPGEHILKIRAMNSRGGIGEREVAFRAGEGQSRVPLVRIEAPETNADLSGNIMIRGYAAAPNLRIIGIDVLIDGISYGRVAYGQPRQQECASLGFTSPNCPNVGFTFSINSTTGFIPLPDGEHRLQLRVQDDTGRFTTHPENPLMLRVNNGENEPPQGVLATPLNGQRVSGNILIWGYAWDPDGRIQNVQLLVDGVLRATLPYGDPRPGECPSLDNIPPCPNIGFWHDFNTKTVLNGPHVLGIRLVDNRGRAVVVPQNAANGLTIIVEN
jgi:hypothetical protein